MTFARQMKLRAAAAGAMLAVAGLAAVPALSQEAAAPASPAAPAVVMQLPSVADLAERLMPSVVEISVEAKQDGMPTIDMPELPDNSPFKDFFDDFFKRHQQQGGGGKPQSRTVMSAGSGFVIDASGVIVTNNHVVEGAESIQVRMHDDSILKAELVGRDPKTDIAVIRVKPDKPLPALAFGDSDRLRIGDWVLAIGNAFALGDAASLGIVSARNRDINAGPYDDFIQTDAAINKGNSGGPLFNMAGEVVGINTAILSPSGGSVGVGFSVPANTAKGVVEQLVKYGETRRGWLGVKIQSVTPDIAESMGMDSPRGALVADVTKTGPAEKAGIEAGDVIVEFNGHPVREMKDLPRIVAETEIGASVPVKVLRKGQEMTVNAEVGRLEDGEKLVADQDAKGMGGDAGPAPAVVTTLGMTVSSLTDELRSKYAIDEGLKGAVVTEVAPDGAAAEKRLEAGDLITEAGEKEVAGAADVSAAVEAAKQAGKNSVLLLVAKGGKQGDMRFIALKLK